MKMQTHNLAYSRDFFQKIDIPIKIQAFYLFHLMYLSIEEGNAKLKVVEGSHGELADLMYEGFLDATDSQISKFGRPVSVPTIKKYLKILLENGYIDIINIQNDAKKNARRIIFKKF